MAQEARIAELLQQGVSRSEIGRLLGVDHRHVCRVARKLGFPPKLRRRTKYDWPAIRGFYEAGHSPAEARLKFGVTEGAWGSAVERGDITLRLRVLPEPGVTRIAVGELLGQGFTQAAIAARLGLSKATVAHHVRALGIPPDARFSRRYDWAAVQRAHDSGLTPGECAKKFGFAKCTWTSAVRRGDLVARPVAMPIEVLLVKGRVQTSRTHLKQRLLAEGLKDNRCEQCGISDWQGEPLNMQLHHKDGDGTNNELGNLELLCPNCHSQTDTYGGRNGHRRKKAA